MKVFHEATSSSLPWYQASSCDMIGQSRVVAMPTAGAPMLGGVYLCPQWNGTAGPQVLADAGGKPVWPQLSYPTVPVSSNVSNLSHVTSATYPAVPYIYPQQAPRVIVTSICNQSLTQQPSSAVSIPSHVQLRHHNSVVQPQKSGGIVFDQHNSPVVSTNMEVVWHGQFDRLFNTFPHQWVLQPASAADTEELNAGQYTVIQDSAKVRFLCKNKCCCNAWTSMKGRVIFWIKAPQYQLQQHGIVRFKLFGQKCQKCKLDTFEPAMWYPQEAVKVIYNLYTRVGQLFYGFAPSDHCTQRRAGKPRQPHKSELCQACANNICREASMATVASRSSSTATSSAAESPSSLRDA